MIDIGNPQGSWECYTKENTTSLNWNEQQHKKRQRKLSDPQNSPGRKQVDITAQQHTFDIILFKKKEKKKKPQELEPQDKRVEPQIQTAELEGGPTVPKTLNLIVFAWLDFEIIWDQWLSFCFLLSLFEMKCLSLL